MRVAIVALAGLASAAIVVAVGAPASWLAGAARAWSDGHVELAEATGTIWNGEAQLVLASGTGDAPLRAALPGRTTWQVSPWRLLLGALDMTLTNPSALSAPLVLRIDGMRRATLDANHLRLPASLLAALGAPWNTVRPGGELTFGWSTLQIADGTVHGSFQVEWSGASSALSPVVPFGHYRLRADGLHDGAHVDLETLGGPMEMTGSGTIGAGGRLQFRGLARVQPGTDPAVATQLSGLVSLLGRREGDGALLNFGT